MKISEAYTLSYLAQNPRTRAIVLRHLEPLHIDDRQLLQVHTTLEILATTNMGGGIPYKTMIELIKQLNELSVTDIKQSL